MYVYDVYEQADRQPGTFQILGNVVLWNKLKMHIFLIAQPINRTRDLMQPTHTIDHRDDLYVVMYGKARRQLH